MTRYTVVWDEDVEFPFINAWVEGTSATRAILSEISNWVDTNLANDPDIKGQSHPALSARIIDVPISSSSANASVIYQVLPDDRQVRVIRLVFRAM